MDIRDVFVLIVDYMNYWTIGLLDYFMAQDELVLDCLWLRMS